MLRSWWRKCKRRKGGVYVWRTRKHASPTRREWGYVGETNSFGRRERDHKGRTAYARSDGTVQATTEKPWMDLDAKMYRVIRLPWWLCWKWVLRPLETLVILLLWPRYNVAKNRWNPRRVPLSGQAAQRRVRDAGGGQYALQVRIARLARMSFQVFGVLLIFMGVIGAVMARG